MINIRCQTEMIEKYDIKVPILGYDIMMLYITN